MEKINYKKEMILWVFLLLPLVYLAYVWNELPTTVPIHFNGEGEANGWAGKASEFIMTGTNLFVYFFMLYLRKIDPKKLNDGFFTTNYFKLRVALIVFLSVLSIMMIYIALPGNEHMGVHWMPACVFLFLSVLGNFMINLKPNWFIGIRTPWTLSSDAVWKKTHQVGGRVFFYGGMICIVASFLLKGAWMNGFMLTFILGSVAFLFGYSFWLFKQEQGQVKE